MIERGIDTLRFGPLKPVGFDYFTDEKPYAVIQLRKENKDGTMVSMVGFQTRLKWGEQKRIFSMLPGLADVEFYRMGSIHRNTYLESPKLLNADLSFKRNQHVFLAGQITGVEGYTESACIGLCAAKNIENRIMGQGAFFPPVGTMIRGLLDYITVGPNGPFQPMNANFGLLPPVKSQQKKLKKQQRRMLMAERAKELSEWYRVSAGAQ